MKNFKELLEELNTCKEGIVWARNMSIEQVVKTCHRGDWLLWLAQQMGLDIRTLTLAKARCAKTVIHLMKDNVSINAVEVAEQFGLGNASIEELNAAAATAAAYDSYAAYAAADAADAYATTAAANTYAAAAAYAYDDADDAYDDAKKENQKQTADICRETFGELLIELVNQKLN